MSSEAIQASDILKGFISRARSHISPRLSPIERKYLLILVDLLLVNVSLLAAVVIWNDFVLSWPALLAHVKWFITLSLVWWVAGTVLDIYNLARSASTTNIMASAGLATLSGAFLYLSIPWLTPPIITRTYALGFVLLSTLTVMAWRVLYAQALVQPAFRRRALVLGASASARELIRELQKAGRIQDANPFRDSGYQIVGLVSDRLEGTSEGADDVSTAIGLPLLGDARQLTRLIFQHGVDEIILALESGHIPSPEVHEALLDCRELGLQIVGLETVYERLTARLPAEYFQRDTNLILGPAESPTFRLYMALKRLVDILLSLFGLMILVLIIPWVALANALWAPGPLFYRQRRIGKGGRSFVIYKFRSMISDAEKHTGAVWCEGDDPRITPVGRWLRKTRLDEVPQFINVLRGEMSIVGPRPEHPDFVGQLTRTLPQYRVRHAVKPGLTGWAQVRYRYGDSVEDARVKLEYDLYYVKHASFFLDFLILLQTIRTALPVRLEASKVHARRGREFYAGRKWRGEHVPVDPGGFIHEAALRRLLSRMPPDHPRYVEALRYGAQLTEDIAQLNELSLSVLGVSFEGLRNLSEPSVTRSPVGRSVEAYATARIKDHPPEEPFFLNAAYVLQAGIQKEILERFESTAISVPGGEEVVEFEITVHAEGMEVEPAWAQPYVFCRSKKAPLLEFLLKPTEEGCKRIRVEFFHQRHWLAKVQFEVEVVVTPELVGA